MTKDTKISNPFCHSISSRELSHWERMEEEWVTKMQQELQACLDVFNCLLFLKEVMITNRSEEKYKYKYVGVRSVRVTLMNGTRVTVKSPTFIFIPPKRPGPRTANKGVLCHPALELLGFIDKKSPEFLSIVVRSAVSNPSFQAASEELSFRRIFVSHEQIRTLTYRYADLFLGKRVENSLDGSEKQTGLNIEITIDGGRTRMREDYKKKNNRRKKTTYKGKWREPILFSIRVLNKKGELAQEVPQLLDATMKNWKNAFKLLEKYLECYNLKEAQKITFLADGSNSIWSNLDPMMKRLGISEYKSVVDYMHAKQNLNIVIDMMNKKQTKAAGKKTRKKMYELLWKGDIDGMKENIDTFFNSKRRGKKAALNKINNYFEHHERFAYEKLTEKDYPIGSGSGESAIRRVINMKLKGNGIFWLEKNCEKMLYLRCQFLTGRWNTLQEKLEGRRLSIYEINELEILENAC